MANIKPFYTNYPSLEVFKQCNVNWYYYLKRLLQYYLFLLPNFLKAGLSRDMYLKKTLVESCKVKIKLNNVDSQKGKFRWKKWNVGLTWNGIEAIYLRC